MIQFKPGDHIWNTYYPFVVGTILQLGTIGRTPVYIIQRDDNNKRDFIFVDEARAAGLVDEPTTTPMSRDKK